MTVVWPLPGVIPTTPPPHGMFGFVRRFDVHTGVDLYAPDGSPVVTIERGKVVAVSPFTGPEAGSPWWAITSYVMVEGDSGVILYGEVSPTVRVDEVLDEGFVIGLVQRVLLRDKGLPTSMLHLELYDSGTRVCCESWLPGFSAPDGIRDPWPIIARFLE